MTIYRIWEHSSFGRKEIAFVKDLATATDFVSALLNPLKEWAGVSPGTSSDRHWTYDRNQMQYTLELGYHWGEMKSDYLLTSYSAEKIFVEE